MIKIYTDGSCLGNPGSGGWAAIIFTNGKKITIKGSKKNTTNNQMELLAPIKALKKIPFGEKIEIFTDSKYLKLGITEWILKWKNNGWKTSNKSKVKNLELWKELHKLVENYQIKWSWVKAHSGNKINEEVDVIARNAANLN
jgi:ribonuclease HI